MNARLYNPTLHRFLEADTFLQDPYNTQNYNKYGYCVNNPLKYTDVTGNVFNIATFTSCIPVVGSIFSSLLMHQPVDWGRVGVDILVTGISIAVTAGIGTAYATIGNFYTSAAVSALAHGVFQGGLSSATGGKFWAGFASGALSSIAASFWQGGSTIETSGNIVTETIHVGIGAGTGTIGTLAFSSIIGGAGSALAGGNFWQGAVTGLIVSGFNHATHDIEGDPNRTGLQTRRYHLDENGNIDSESLIYVPKGDSVIYNRAISEPLHIGELTVYSHGNYQGFADIFNFNVNYGVSNVLYSDSLMWRNFINNKGSNLTMVLKSCNTGNETHNTNISRVLTQQFPRLTIYAPSSYWASNGRVLYHSKGITYYGQFNKYQKGALVGFATNK